MKFNVRVTRFFCFPVKLGVMFSTRTSRSVYTQSIKRARTMLLIREEYCVPDAAIWGGYRVCMGRSVLLFLLSF